jgi:hypothetical protein
MCRRANLYRPGEIRTTALLGTFDAILTFAFAIPIIATDSAGRFDPHTPEDAGQARASSEKSITDDPP